MYKQEVEFAGHFLGKDWRIQTVYKKEKKKLGEKRR